MKCRGSYAEFLRCHGFLPVPVKTASQGLTVAPHADVRNTPTPTSDMRFAGVVRARDLCSPVSLVRRPQVRELG
jgi:hypothetical protein